MDDNYKRYNKLFLNGQESYYLGDYSTCYKPFITAEGKLKYTSPHPDSSKGFQTKHIKYKLDDLRRHLVITEYGAADRDEKGIGTNENFTSFQQPCYTEVKIGSHTVIEQIDHGIVLNPLGENGTGIWAAIDEDVYNDPQHLKDIVQRIYKEKLPIVPCYSKSGGLHLYFFFDEPFTYDEIKKVLLYYKKLLNCRAKELFPKQPKKPGKPGNGIHLPYRSCVLEYKDGINYNFRPIKNTLVNEDLSQGKFEEFLSAAENNKITKNIFDDMPVLEIKEQPETKVKVTEEKILIPVEPGIRQPSKAAAEIIRKINKGTEHKDGGTFDNHIVSLVACCIMRDKRSDEEIKAYFDEVKHRSDKSKISDYIKDKIKNCRNKFNKPDPGPKITEFFLTTYWNCEEDKYFNSKKNRHHSDKSLNQIYSPLFPNDTTPTKEFYQNENKRIVDGLVYRPDLHDKANPENRLVKDKSMIFVNKYIEHKLQELKPTEGDLKLFFELVNYLFPNEKERNHILDFLAFCVQNPGKKIKHAILVYSSEYRIGKGSLFDVMTDILGEDNCEPGSVKSILDKGVMFSEKLLVLIDECSSTGDFSEKRNLVNDLKTIISEERIQKRVLYRDFGVTKSFTNFLIFTNNPDALTIDANDGRYFVVDNYEPRKDQKFYDTYHEWRLNKGAAFVKYYLLHRDISKFNPMKPPPMTEAKKRMASHTENPLLMEMRSAYDEGQMPFPFNEQIRGISETAEYYQKFGSQKIKKFADNPKTMKKCFEALGFLEIGQVLHKDRNEKPSLWIVRNQKKLREQYKNTDLCNDIWKPLQHRSNADLKEQRQMDNFQQRVNTLENQLRTEQSLSIPTGSEEEANQRVLNEALKGNY